ncbi:MAG TPA: ABC transporter permease [Tianweitania sediminis]|nr:ABC transporter permease [Tianweitania sediminis]
MRTTAIIKGLTGFLVAAAGWELVRATGLIDPRSLPSLGAIMQSMLVDLAGSDGLLFPVLATLRTWSIGLAVAALLGSAIGIVLALSPIVETITRPIIEFLRPIPSVALIPVALLVLGIGFSMHLFMIVFAAIWPVIFSAKAGVEDVDPRQLETGRVFGLSRAARVYRLVLPAALPSIATGIRTASAIALVLTITVEMLVGRHGIGSFLENMRLNGLVTEMWSAIILTGIVGYLVNVLFLMLEKHFIPWSGERHV